MGFRGVHFALEEKEVNVLRSKPSDEERLDYLQEVLEEEYFNERQEWVAESDKAWDAIHRTLTDGHLAWDNGVFPLSHVILGGEFLYELDDYIMSLKTPAEVKEIAESLATISADEFKERYFRIDSDSYDSEIGEDDLEYTWSWFEAVRDLYQRAATVNRFVLFTSDQ